MKLVIQIPCFNEQEHISEVLKNIPKKIKGIKTLEIFVIDDGSSDDTVKIAEEFGVNVIKLPFNQGLSQAFKIGVKNALENKADILVNIDGDNQYCASDIEKLIEPLINNECDMVIGTRPIEKIKTFSPFKKAMQKFGSFIVKLFSRVDVKDAASGLRAFNRNALLKLNIFNPFTYTIESIIQARYKNLIIKNVEIDVNYQKNRKSKLFNNIFSYIFKQAKNIIRFFIIYRPCRFFSSIAITLFLIGVVLGFRFLFYFLNGFGSGHIQSLILCAIILILSFICFACAILGDLLSINRKLLEDIQYEIRLNKYKK